MSVLPILPSTKAHVLGHLLSWLQTHALGHRRAYASWHPPPHSSVMPNALFMWPQNPPAYAHCGPSGAEGGVGRVTACARSRRADIHHHRCRVHSFSLTSIIGLPLPDCVVTCQGK